MAVNSFATDLNPAHTRNPGPESSRRLEDRQLVAEAGSFNSSLESGLAETFQTIADEADALSSEIREGEPAFSASARTLRGRLSAFLKRRLYRLFWWHTREIQNLSALIARSGRAELDLVQQSRETQRLLLTVIGKVQERDKDLQQLKSAQERFRGEISQQNSHYEQTSQQIKAATISVEAAVGELRSALGDISAKLTHQIAQNDPLANRFSELEKSVRDVQDKSARIEELASQAAARISELGVFTHNTRRSLDIQDRRLARFIEEARARLPEPFAQNRLEAMVNEHTEHRYDSLYAEFEDLFRGSREEIKARHTVYLDVLKEGGIGSESMPVLDLGCGRGEWLELLGEQGLSARGVDSNEQMIERCASLNLPVVKDDALSYLKNLPSESQGSITAFHMVEHMPFDVVMTLIDESLRVLKVGGILILETPNPRNILVGAYTFYFDPSHRNPLPGPMLRFFVEARGFCDVRLLELHPYPETVRLPEDGNGIAARFNEYFYGPQDYAVIGRRP